MYSINTQETTTTATKVSIGIKILACNYKSFSRALFFLKNDH